MFIPLHDHNGLKSIRLQYVTLLLIATNVIIWLLMAGQQLGDFTQANAIFYSYGFIPAVVGDVTELPPEFVVIPENASYVTYAFLHAGFMHLAGNMLFLWVFGDNVEDSTGHFRFFVFYLLCAAAGALAHQLVVPDSQVPLVGASGAAAGIVGAYLILHPKVKLWVLVLGRIPLRLSAGWVLGAWIAYQIFSLVADSEDEVSWAAHVGGFFAGALLIFVFKRREVPLFDANLHEKAVTDTALDENKNQEKPSATDDQRWGRGS